MKIAKFFKTTVICICLAASFATAGLAMVGCGGENPAAQKPNKTEEIKQATSAAVDFLNTVKYGGNYYSVSEYSDGSVYKYYTEDGKIKVEYKNEVFYGQKVGSRLYKISQADDMTWHKTTDTTDLTDPATRINSLINRINNTSKASLWTDYNSKTKTLTATYSDGPATLKLDASEFILTINLDTGTTTTHTIKDVGTTTVTLPEDIIDDVLN